MADTLRRGAPLFALLMAVYLASPIKTNFDSRWTIPTAISLLREGNLSLDEYAPTFASGTEAVIPGRGGHLYSSFPLAVPLVAVVPLALFQGAARAGCPVAGVIPAVRKGCDRWFAHYESTGAIDPDFFDTTQLIIASLLTALAAVVLYEIARMRLEPAPAFALALLFGLGTPAWSTATRALWQHAPSMLALALALRCFAKAERGEGRVRAAGAWLAAAFVLRPTGSIPFAVLGGYALLRHRRDVPGFALAAAAVLLPWFALNAATFGAALPPYFDPERVGPGSGTVLEALAGDLVSPSRGVLVYCPFLLVTLWSVATRAWRRELSPFEWALALSVALHWVVVARFPHWWAGHSFGPRFFADAFPALMVLTIPALERSVTPALRAALAVTAALAVAIHARGATSWAPWRWNGEPVNVDDAPQRVWDWSDPQFLRRAQAVSPRAFFSSR